MNTARATAALAGLAFVASFAVVARPVASGQSVDPPSSGPAQFHAETDVVRVYATVRNTDGRLVTDLGEGDFEVRDRGQRVPLALFSKDAQPITVAIMVDLSGSLFEVETFDRLRTALYAFVDQLTPQDRVRVGWFSRSEIEPGQGWTSDHSVVKQAILDEIRVERAHPQFHPAGPHSGFSVLSLSHRGRPLWNAVAVAMRTLSTQRGRKVALMLANGPNTGEVSGMPGLAYVKGAIPTDEFMVYGVTGFEPRLTETVEYSSMTLRELTQLTGGGYFDAPFDRRKARSGSAVAEHPLGMSLVTMLADVVDELRHQYTLGFVPTRRDGKVGKIDVRVKPPNSTVWARKSYLAPSVR